MYHAITLGGLLLGIGVLIGLASAAFGALTLFAEGMSDAPQEGQSAGCVFVIVGAVVLIGSVIGLVI